MNYILIIFSFIIMSLNSATAFGGLKSLHRTKRANVYLEMGSSDFYYTMDTYTVRFKNTGRLQTRPITTNLPAGPFSITRDECAGIQLAIGATCEIDIMYTHPGTYPQSRTLTISAEGFSAEAFVLSCNPMFC